MDHFKDHQNFKLDYLEMMEIAHGTFWHGPLDMHLCDHGYQMVVIRIAHVQITTYPWLIIEIHG